MLNAAIIGLGGISASHRKGYYNLEKAGKVRLVAAYDINPEAFSSHTVTNLGDSADGLSESLRFYTDLDEMLRNEEIDFVDICIPTYLHKEMSEKMLRLGYHVLCEKPMALTYDDAKEMIRAADESGKELMIGQCLRFYPAFDYIKDVVDTKKFGKLLGATFSRLSPTPTWGWNNWFMKPELSGGCLTDLHIHDIDVIRYLFGEPDGVSSRATTSVSLYDTVHTSLYYGNVPITAIGDWTLQGVPFEARAQLNFSLATLIFDGNKLTVYPKDGTDPYEAVLEKISGYESEISYFCDVVEGKISNTKNTARSAAETVRLIEHLRKSVELQGEKIEFGS